MILFIDFKQGSFILEIFQKLIAFSAEYFVIFSQFKDIIAQ